MFLTVLIWKGSSAAMLSLKMKQVTPTSIPFPIYPIKIFIPISAIIMLAVVFKKFVNDVITVVTGEKRKASA
jgi:TRAP-type mannitol/chloroaromatic compound transport system permease small subunit